jgi:hypothetical protein
VPHVSAGLTRLAQLAPARDMCDGDERIMTIRLQLAAPIDHTPLVGEPKKSRL